MSLMSVSIEQFATGPFVHVVDDLQTLITKCEIDRVFSSHKMAPSSPLSTSDPPQVAEPVVKDSLSYWEKQSATYNGVLGVCDQSRSSPKV